MPEINNKEYVGLTQEGVDKKGVDKFTLDDTLLQEEFDKALQNSKNGLEKSDYEELKAKIDGLVKQINKNNDDLLDTGIMDGGKIDVNDNQEITALNVIKEKIVQELNVKIDELLKSDIDLKYHIYETLGKYDLLPQSLINEVELAVNKNDKPYLQQLVKIRDVSNNNEEIEPVIISYNEKRRNIEEQLMN